MGSGIVQSNPFRKEDGFDMLKSIGFWDLARPFSSSRRSDSVYLG